jgi:hypothetical protein
MVAPVVPSSKLDIGSCPKRSKAFEESEIAEVVAILAPYILSLAPRKMLDKFILV